MLLVGGPSSDVSSTLLEHILDNTKWNLLPGLTPVQLPFGLSVHVLMLFLAFTLIASMLWIAARPHSLKSRGWTLAVELVVVFVRDELVVPLLGKERGRRWLPYFLTLFLFIFVLNVLGLVPLFRSATGNPTVTSALATLTLALILVSSFGRLGVGGFFRNLVPLGIPFGVGLFVAVLELGGLFLRGAVLSLRLFANLFAGHLAILCFLALAIVVNPAMVVFSLPFALFTSLLEVLISLIQALVFTLLGCLFLQMASSSHEVSA